MNIHGPKIQCSIIQITIFCMTLLLPFACIFPTAASFSFQATHLLSLLDEIQGISFCGVNKASSIAIRYLCVPKRERLILVECQWKKKCCFQKSKKSSSFTEDMGSEHFNNTTKFNMTFWGKKSGLCRKYAKCGLFHSIGLVELSNIKACSVMVGRLSNVVWSQAQEYLGIVPREVCNQMQLAERVSNLT